MKKIWQGLVSIILCAMLCACGFGLRQPQTMAPKLQIVYIQTVLPATPNDPFVQTLTRVLMANNVTIVNDPKLATSILNILSDQTSNSMVAGGGVNVSGFYTASLNVQFSLTDPQGQYLIAPNTISQQQSFTSNATQVLSGNFTATQLANQMNQSVAQQVIDQLVKVKP
jgi:outer membrane lipopolysaccharide assembly protein LptE/RlpB